MCGGRAMKNDLQEFFSVKEETPIDVKRREQRRDLVRARLRCNADAAVRTQGARHGNKFEERALTLQNAFRFEYIMDGTKKKKIGGAIFF